MEGIEFDLDNNQGLKSSSSAAGAASPRHSFLISLLAKMGVTDPTVANIILIGTAGLFFGIAIFMYAGILGEKATPKLSSVEISRGLKALSEMQNAQNLEK